MAEGWAGSMGQEFSFIGQRLRKGLQARVCGAKVQGVGSMATQRNPEQGGVQNKPQLMPLSASEPQRLQEG